jgi:3-deoxy-D-manno-octulosonic-acid transferase
MKGLYTISVFLYALSIRIAALWNKKAADWVKGRQNLFDTLKKEVSRRYPLVWIHCASAGEFEQGKPVIEAIKKRYPHYKILVSFFSPSGYEVGKKYKGADHICYLPVDTKENAVKFLYVTNPKLVIFVKYEYWYHHLSAVNKRKIPSLLISAIFRKDQVFFKSYGSLFRRILRRYTHLFVQDEESRNLLQKIRIRHCTVNGDTRFDRVKELTEHFSEVRYLSQFTDGGSCLVAGSTWPEDETLLLALAKKRKDLKVVIAPHEINRPRIEKLLTSFPYSMTYSEAGTTDPSEYQTLIIDNVGMLSKLYHYASITYVGGGFTNSGIHNTLEAAVWGKPVVFGPNYQKFKEAKELIACGAGFSVTTTNEFIKLVNDMIRNGKRRSESGLAAQEYVTKNGGATDKILGYIQENRLLTS